MYINKIIRFIKKNVKSLNEYRCYIKSVKKLNIKHDIMSKPRIAFIIEYPETWSSLKKVYDLCVNKGLEVIILCIPKSLFHDKQFTFDKDEKNISWEYLKNEKNSVNAYLGNNKWFNLERFKPDYTFYSRPYNIEYPTMYQSNMVSKYSKVCFIPYGYNMSVIRFGSLNWLITYNADFLLNTYITFTTDKYSLKKIKRKFFIPYLLKSNNYKYLGYPRFDLLSNIKLKNKLSQKTTITWMPRWDFRKNRRNTSNFLLFYTEFIKYVKQNPTIRFIFRPHPLMFQELESKKIISKANIMKIKEELSLLNNLDIDYNGDYIKTLQKTDILIADMTSLLIEFFITGKPIIYCNSTKGLEKNARLIINASYHAKQWNQVKKYIDIILKGNDYKEDKRIITIKKILEIENNNSSKNILDYLLKDYYKR